MQKKKEEITENVEGKCVLFNSLMNEQLNKMHLVKIFIIYNFYSQHIYFLQFFFLLNKLHSFDYFQRSIYGENYPIFKEMIFEFRT